MTVYEPLLSEYGEAVPEPPTAKPVDPARRFAPAGALLLILPIVLMYRWFSGTPVEELEGFGYAGVFLAMLVSGGSTFFPVPGQVVVLFYGAVWNPVLVGIASGLGNATGETVGYLTARAATHVFDGIDRSRWTLLFRKWFDRYGFFTILGIAAIPNPIFDIVGIVAATASYPLRRFWLACVLGNCVKYVGMAYFGRVAGAFFDSLF